MIRYCMSILILFLFCKTSYSYNSEFTHRDITLITSEYVDLDDSLAFKFYEDGLLSTFENASFMDNFVAGAIDEDADIMEVFGRFYNHFHNPLFLYPWDGAGLYFGALAAPAWAQNEDVQSDSIGGDRTWLKARTDYWTALIS